MTVKELKELIAHMSDEKEVVIYLDNRKELNILEVRNNFTTNEVIIDVTK